MTLNVLISTIDTGINKIPEILLAPRKDVTYIVAHQYTHDGYKEIPESLSRNDVFVSQIPGKGLTRSRNHAINLASGDIAVIADDDVRYKDEYFDTIIKTFEENSNVDIALFKIKTLTGENEYKEYPSMSYNLTTQKMHSPSSIEIAFKLSSIKNKLKFDERFGMGSYLNGGEELFFITDAIEMGLNVKYFPEYIVIHPQESTIKKIAKYDKQRLKVTGGIYARKFSLMAVPKIFARTILFVPELIRHKKNPVAYLYQMFIGCFYILFTKKTK